MSTFSAARTIATPAAQLPTEKSSPSEPLFVPTAGLGIEGINSNLGIEHHGNDRGTEVRASTDSANDYLQLPVEFGDGLNATPTVVPNGLTTSTACPFKKH